MTAELERKIKLLPESPGVYVMLNAEGNVIYVGKAKRLKNRVTQYFRNGYKTEKVAAMVMNIVDFYYIITPSEADALTLENTLIKKHKPKYNILLKDDKSYPYIKVNLKEEYPSFTITRKIKNDGAKYFGPFMLGVGVHDILDIIKDAYLIRPCNYKLSSIKTKRECLNYHIGLCPAPCANKISKQDYLEQVKKAMDFLSGNDSAKELLTQKMFFAAEREEFERASIYRDRLKMISKLKEKEIVALNRFITADVIATKSDGIFASIVLMFIRSGRVTGVKTFSAQSLSDCEDARLSEFINRYYVKGTFIPDEIILSNELLDANLLSEHLTELRGKKCQVITAKKGVKRSLLDMAEKNAEDYLTKQISKVKHHSDMTLMACEHLKEILGLKKYPRRIECYDISHISGVDKVGSMAVFIDGEPSKDDYRRFKIKTVEGNNDFACLQEVLLRRLKKLGTQEEEKFPVPDLIVIDGGKGQLSSVKQVFDKLNVDIELISLAERDEEIFTLNSNEPLILKKSDYCLQMLQRLRDEAHRFAITFNRNLRSKRTLKSVLTEIDGIGKKKRDALINKFKDLSTILSASEQELATVEGIGEVQAKKIKEYFANTSK